MVRAKQIGLHIAHAEVYYIAFSSILLQTEFLMQINITKWGHCCPRTKPTANRPGAQGSKVLSHCSHL